MSDSYNKIVKEMVEVASLMYHLGWDERNAGNISYLIDEQELKLFKLNLDGKIYSLQKKFIGLKGKYFLVTGTGKYFRKFKDNPKECVGLIRITEDEENYEILWGLEDSKATSELSTHLAVHKARLEVDRTHKVVIHTHTTYTNIMSIVSELDEVLFTRKIWSLNTENIIIIPEGVGIVPWCIPGNSEIAKETAGKFKTYKIVLWPLHGVVASGESFDSTIGLIETLEKGAFTYIKAKSLGIKQTISNNQLKKLAKEFGVIPNKEILR